MVPRGAASIAGCVPGSSSRRWPSPRCMALPGTGGHPHARGERRRPGAAGSGAGSLRGPAASSATGWSSNVARTDSAGKLVLRVQRSVAQAAAEMRLELGPADRAQALATVAARIAPGQTNLPSLRIPPHSPLRWTSSSRCSARDGSARVTGAPVRFATVLEAGASGETRYVRVAQTGAGRQRDHRPHPAAPPGRPATTSSRWSPRRAPSWAPSAWPATPSAPAVTERTRVGAVVVLPRRVEARGRLLRSNGQPAATVRRAGDAPGRSVQTGVRGRPGLARRPRPAPTPAAATGCCWIPATTGWSTCPPGARPLPMLTEERVSVGRSAGPGASSLPDAGAGRGPGDRARGRGRGQRRGASVRQGHRRRRTAAGGGHYRARWPSSAWSSPTDFRPSTFDMGLTTRRRLVGSPRPTDRRSGGRAARDPSLGSARHERGLRCHAPEPTRCRSRQVDPKCETQPPDPALTAASRAGGSGVPPLPAFRVAARAGRHLRGRRLPADLGGGEHLPTAPRGPQRAPGQRPAEPARAAGCWQELSDVTESLQKHLEKSHYLLGGYDQAEAQRWASEGAFWRNQWKVLGERCRLDRPAPARGGKELDEMVGAYRELDETAVGLHQGAAALRTRAGAPPGSRPAPNRPHRQAPGDVGKARPGDENP